MSLSLLHQLVFLILVGWFMKWEVGGHTIVVLWGFAPKNLFKTAPSIFVLFPSRFFSMHFVNIHEVHPYSSTDTAIAWKKSHFILSEKSDFHITDNLSMPLMTSLSVDEIFELFNQF